ncbi:MAG: lipoate--protein ligase family protein [Thermodesulfovibrionales bacterium]
MSERQWRLIDSSDCDGYYNMALDEAISESVIAGLAPTTLRFYGWKTKTVSLGAFQRVEDIDIVFCNEHHIPIVRRPTGGRAILHFRELTYSISSANLDIFSKDIKGSYILISRIFIDALNHLGVETEFSDRRLKGRDLIKSPLCFNAVSVGEITFQGKKLIGSAQKRWTNGFLQQGSIPLVNDYKTIDKVFSGVDAYAFTDIQSINPSITIDNLKDCITESFERCFQVSLCLCQPLEAEHQRALQLVEVKYQTHEWTHQRVGNYERKRGET